MKSAFGLVAAAALLGCEKSSDLMVAASDPCAVASAFVEQQNAAGRRIVVNSGPLDGNFEAHALEAIQSDMRMDPAPMHLLRQLADTRDENILERCPSFAEGLKEKGIETGREAVHAASKQVDRRGDFAADIVAISVPVISSDGRSAVIGADRISGGEAGGGAIYHMRRGADGAWRVVDQAATWIA